MIFIGLNESIMAWYFRWLSENALLQLVKHNIEYVIDREDKISRKYKKNHGFGFKLGYMFEKKAAFFILFFNTS